MVWRFGGFGVGSEVGPDILIAVGLASKAFLLVLRAHSKHHGSKEKVKSPLDRCKARQGFPETDFDHTTPLHFAVTVKFKPLLGHSRLWAAWHQLACPVISLYLSLLRLYSTLPKRNIKLLHILSLFFF